MLHLSILQLYYMEVKLMFKIEKESSEYENKSLRLPKDLINQVQALADENNISFNRVVIQSIRYALSHMDDDESN